MSRSAAAVTPATMTSSIQLGMATVYLHGMNDEFG
jgi:hypothetical protein